MSVFNSPGEALVTVYLTFAAIYLICHMRTAYFRAGNSESVKPEDRWMYESPDWTRFWLGGLSVSLTWPVLLLAGQLVGLQRLPEYVAELRQRAFIEEMRQNRERPAVAAGEGESA